MCLAQPLGTLPAEDKKILNLKRNFFFPDPDAPKGLGSGFGLNECGSETLRFELRCV
jgi:hypothetical protein